MNARLQPSQADQGTILAVRGSVVDAKFPQGLPKLHSILRAGEHQQVVIEVVAHLTEEHVRGIALTATRGLARGAARGKFSNPGFDVQDGRAVHGVEAFHDDGSSFHFL